MGYEVKFTYFAKDEEGGDFDRENPQSFVKKIGKMTDDVPLEKLVFLIMNQRSRRDIWVDDVEIFQYVKKKLSFKESANGDGIIIGNKKFGANIDFSNITSGELVDDEENSIIEELKKQVASLTHQMKNQPQASNANSSQSNNTSKNSVPQKPIKYEYFSPDPDLHNQIKSSGMKLTFDQRYPIFKESVRNGTEYYVVQDDTNKQVLVPSFYFIPNLSPIDSTGANLLSSTDNGAGNMNTNLSNMGSYSGPGADMPVLRR